MEMGLVEHLEVFGHDAEGNRTTFVYKPAERNERGEVTLYCLVEKRTEVVVEVYDAR